MTEQHLVILIVTAAVVVVLALWAIAAIVNRPKNVEHDLRRRALGIVGAMSGVPIGVAYLATTPAGTIVAIAVLIAWTVVMVVCLRLVFAQSTPKAPS